MSANALRTLDCDDAMAALEAAFKAWPLSAIALRQRVCDLLGSQGSGFKFYVIEGEFVPATGARKLRYTAKASHRFAHLLVALWTADPDLGVAARLLDHLEAASADELRAEARDVNVHPDWMAILDRKLGARQ